MLIHRIEKRLQEEAIAKKYVKMLEDTLERIENRLNSMFIKTNKDGKWSQSELVKYNRDMKLKAQIRAEIKKYKEDFHKSLRDDLKKEYIQESLYVQDVLNTQAGIEFDKLPTNAIKTAVIDQNVIGGKRLSEYLSKFSTDVAFKIESEVFQGIALGSNPRVVADRLYKAGAMGRRRAEVTTRTWYNSVINSANISVYEQVNIKMCRWVSTLDSRTSSICIARHNKPYPIEEIRNMLPAHYNCRSTAIPIIDGVEQSKPPSYESWILDKRRSVKQLNKTSSKIQQAYQVGQISKADKDRFEKVLDEAFRNKIKDSNRFNSKAKNGIIKYLGRSGAKEDVVKSVSQYFKFLDDADKFYEIRRKNNSDIVKIATNTGFSIDKINRVKKHLFFDEILFEDGRKERFDSNVDQALAWKRLMQGTNIKESDMLMLKHELEEIKHIEKGMAYEKAHKKANEKYNWEEAIKGVADYDNIFD